MKSHPPRALPLLSTVALSLVILPSSPAADRTWTLTSGSGNFVDTGNWSGNAVPATGDKAIINQTGSTVLINAGNVIEYGEMDFGAGVIAMTGGSISATGRQHVYSLNGSAASPAATVSGGATWSTTERFVIGEYGGAGTTHVLVTGAGSALSADNYFVIGNGAGTTASVTLEDGAKLQKLTATNKLIVGDAGTATLTVNAATDTTGTAVESAGEVNVGWNGGYGEVTLNGYSAMSTTEGSGKSIMIGINNSAIGVVTLNDSSKLTADNEIWVGNGSGSTGTLNVYDHATATGETNNFHIGRDGSTGTVNVGGATAGDPDGSGKLVAGNNLLMSESAGGQAYLNVNSHGWVEVTNVLTAGNAGAAEVILSDNATLRAGEIKVGLNAGASGTFTMNDDSSVMVSGNMSIGRDKGTGMVSINDTADLSVANLKVGQWAEGSTAILEMHGAEGGEGATLTASDGISVGYWYCTGTMIMDGKSSVDVSGGDFVVGEVSATGNLTVGDRSAITLSGGGAFVAARDNGGGNITVNGNAIISTVTGDIVIGENGTASLTMNDSASVTSGGGYVYVGSGPTSNDEKNAGNGTLTVNGGTLTAGTAVVVAERSNATGALQVNGGTVRTAKISRGAGSGTVSFDGGKVVALAASDDFFEGFESGTVETLGNGVSFDTNGHNVTITQALTGDGGLMKLGAGVLTLEMVGYDGNTWVKGGWLTLNSAGLSDSGDLWLTTGVVLELNFTDTDVIHALYIDGVPLDEGLYDASNLSEFLAGDGVLMVTAIPEPATVGLLLAAGVGFFALRRHRRA